MYFAIHQISPYLSFFVLEKFMHKQDHNQTQGFQQFIGYLIRHENTKTAIVGILVHLNPATNEFSPFIFVIFK